MLYGIRISQYLEIPHNTLLATRKWSSQKMWKLSSIIIALLALLLVGCVPNQSVYKKAPILENSATPATGISIKAPNYVENPNVVPFFVDVDRSLKAGDTLNFYIDNRLAYSVQPTGGALVSFLSGRVRSFKGVMKAEVVRSNGDKSSKQLSFKQDRESFIPDVEDHNTEYMERAAPGQIKALFKNYMGAKSYIGTVYINTSAGEIQVSMTPYAAMNPFIWVKGNFSDANIRGVDLASHSKDSPDKKNKPTFPEAATVSTGTGWFSEYGLFVTNHHVVKGASDITIVKPDGTAIPVVAVVDDRENDLSLLGPLDNKSIKGLHGIPLATQPASIGAIVFTIGYPVTGVLGKAPKLTNGIVSSSTGIEDDPRQYQITVPLQPGNSGGPLINNNGEVIGVVTSSLSSLYMAKKTGSLPQNVNFAVKSDYIKPIAMNSSKKLLVDVLPRSKGDLESLAKRVKGSIALVVAK